MAMAASCRAFYNLLSQKARRVAQAAHAAASRAIEPPATTSLVIFHSTRLSNSSGAFSGSTEAIHCFSSVPKRGKPSMEIVSPAVVEPSVATATRSSADEGANYVSVYGALVSAVYIVKNPTYVLGRAGVLAIMSALRRLLKPLSASVFHSAAVYLKVSIPLAPELTYRATAPLNSLTKTIACLE